MFLSHLRNARGVSAVGTAIVVAVGVGAAGAALLQRIEKSRQAGFRDQAKAVARQLNSSALEMTMSLMKSQTILQESVDGRTIWVSRGGNPSSGERTFTPDAGPGAPARVIFASCDPRFANGATNLSECSALDRVDTQVTLLPDNAGKREVMVVTSVPVVRRNPATDRATEITETASDRALLSESNFECAFAPVPIPAGILTSGQTFLLRLNNVSRSEAIATVVETGTVMNGGDTKEVALVAPIVNEGQPPRLVNYTVRLTLASGQSVTCPSVSLTVRSCSAIASDEAVREVYRGMSVNVDTDVPASTVASHANLVATGAMTLEDLENQIWNSSAYGVRSNFSTLTNVKAKELAITSIAAYRALLGRAGTDSEIRARTSSALLDTASRYPNCLYSNSGSGCSSRMNFPKIAAAIRALPEFAAAPNSSTVHSELVKEAYKRYFGLDDAGLSLADKNARDSYVGRLSRGEMPYWTLSSAGVVNELTRDPRYVARGGLNGEGVNAMTRVLYGRSASNEEATYYAGLMTNFGATGDYVSKSLRNTAEWAAISGCPVPKPIPVCRILTDKTSVLPGESFTVTLQAYDHLSSVTWDNSVQSISGTGPQVFRKSMVGGAAGARMSSNAIVAGEGGSSGCAVSVEVRHSCDMVQGRRGTAYCSSNYTETFAYIPGPGPYHHAYYHVGGFGTYMGGKKGWGDWDSADVLNWNPGHQWMFGTPAPRPHEWFTRSNTKYQGFVLLTTMAPPQPPRQMGNYSRVNCDGENSATVDFQGRPYIIFSDPRDPSKPLKRASGGVCGSAECVCYLKAQVSPLVVDFQDKGIAYKPGVFFDLGEGVQEYFWPDYQQSSYFVVLDRNGNGKVDDGQELFGNITVGPNKEKYDNGFEALAQYDSNKDKFIDSKDPVFAKLQLWGDANMNGMSEPSELRSLSEAGVKSFDLEYLDIQEMNDNFGNKSNQRSVVELKNGEFRRVFDLWFASSGIGKPSRDQSSK